MLPHQPRRVYGPGEAIPLHDVMPTPNKVRRFHRGLFRRQNAAPQTYTVTAVVQANTVTATVADTQQPTAITIQNNGQYQTLQAGVYNQQQQQQQQQSQQQQQQQQSQQQQQTQTQQQQQTQPPQQQQTQTPQQQQTQTPQQQQTQTPQQQQSQTQQPASIGTQPPQTTPVESQAPATGPPATESLPPGTTYGTYIPLVFTTMNGAGQSIPTTVLEPTASTPFGSPVAVSGTPSVVVPLTAIPSNSAGVTSTSGIFSVPGFLWDATYVGTQAGSTLVSTLSPTSSAPSSSAPSSSSSSSSSDSEFSKPPGLSTSTPTGKSNSGGGFSNGKVAGTVVGAVLGGLLVLGLLGWLLWRWKRQRDLKNALALAPPDYYTDSLHPETNTIYGEPNYLTGDSYRQSDLSARGLSDLTDDSTFLGKNNMGYARYDENADYDDWRQSMSGLSGMASRPSARSSLDRSRRSSAASRDLRAPRKQSARYEDEDDESDDTDPYDDDYETSRHVTYADQVGRPERQRGQQAYGVAPVAPAVAPAPPPAMPAPVAAPPGYVDPRYYGYYDPRYVDPRYMGGYTDPRYYDPRMSMGDPRYMPRQAPTAAMPGSSDDSDADTEVDDESPDDNIESHNETGHQSTDYTSGNDYTTTDYETDNDDDRRHSTQAQPPSARPNDLPLSPLNEEFHDAYPIPPRSAHRPASNPRSSGQYASDYPSSRSVNPGTASTSDLQSSSSGHPDNQYQRISTQSVLQRPPRSSARLSAPNLGSRHTTENDPSSDSSHPASSQSLTQLSGSQLSTAQYTSSGSGPSQPISSSSGSGSGSAPEHSASYAGPSYAHIPEESESEIPVSDDNEVSSDYPPPEFGRGSALTDNYYTHQLFDVAGDRSYMGSSASDFDPIDMSAEELWGPFSPTRST